MLGEDTTKFVEQTLDKWTMSHFFLYSNDDILLMILKLPDNALWAKQWKQGVPKFVKVKAQFLLIFDPNLKIPVLTGKKLFKY